MAEFLLEQIDYSFLLGGLAFVLLAVIIWPTGRREGDRMPWRALAWFALLSGAMEWMELLGLSLGEDAILVSVRLILAAGSLLFLAEFGRAGCVAQGVKAPGRWVLLPLAALAFPGAEARMPGLGAAGLAALAWTGGLSAALAMRRHCRLSRPGACETRVAAAAILLYALTFGVVAIASVFLPDLAAAPLRAVPGGLALVAAFAFWRRGEKERHKPLAVRGGFLRLSSELLPPVFLGIVLVSGWAATQWVGETAERREEIYLQGRAKTAAAAINPEQVQFLGGSEADLANSEYGRIKEQLIRLRLAAPDVRFYYLLRQTAGGIVFLADSEPSESPDYSPPGQVYDEPDAGMLATFDTGLPAVDGPSKDRWGTWVSGYAPVVTKGGRMIALLGVDIDASRWTMTMARERLAPILIAFLLSGLFLVFHAALLRDREAQDVLARVAGEHAALLNTIETQVWYLKDEETYGVANEAHAAFLGCLREDVEHRSLRNFMTTEETERRIAGNRAVFQSKRSLRAEEWYSDAGGCTTSIVRPEDP